MLFKKQVELPQLHRIILFLWVFWFRGLWVIFTWVVILASGEALVGSVSKVTLCLPASGTNIDRHTSASTGGTFKACDTNRLDWIFRFLSSWHINTLSADGSDCW